MHAVHQITTVRHSGGSLKLWGFGGPEASEETIMSSSKYWKILARNLSASAKRLKTMGGPFSEIMTPNTH